MTRTRRAAKGKQKTTKRSTPKRWLPKERQQHWTICMFDLEVLRDEWSGDWIDFFKRTLFGCHRTKRDALAHLKALRAWTTERLGSV